MRHARVLHIAPDVINRIGCSLAASGLMGVATGAFSADLTLALVGAGTMTIGAGVCRQLGNDPLVIQIPWPAPTATEPAREPAAYPAKPGQCYVCGMFDPARVETFGTATHPECEEWLGNWESPAPEIPPYRHPIIMPKTGGPTPEAFTAMRNLISAFGTPANNLAIPNRDPESTADAVRRNAHRCTVLCANETHGDGKNDLCKCSTCVSNRGDGPTEQEIREAFNDLNARHARLDGHLRDPPLPPPQFLGYTAYPRHGYVINGVCQRCKLIADYRDQPKWVSKLPPFEPDPDLTQRIKE